MSILSGICVGAVRPAIAQLEQNITFHEQIVNGIKSFNLNKLGSFSLKTLHFHEKDITKGGIALITVKTCMEKKIDDLRAAILTLKNFIPNTLNGLESFSPIVVQIMESYLENNSSSSENSLGIKLFIP